MCNKINIVNVWMAKSGDDFTHCDASLDWL